MATPLIDTLTDADGRCPPALLEGAALVAGIYDMEFAAGDYFAAQGVMLPEPRFLNQIVIRFGTADASGHDHVPLLVSPYGYPTYRGS